MVYFHREKWIYLYFSFFLFSFFLVNGKPANIDIAPPHFSPKIKSFCPHTSIISKYFESTKIISDFVKAFEKISFGLTCDGVFPSWEMDFFLYFSFILVYLLSEKRRLNSFQRTIWNIHLVFHVISYFTHIRNLDIFLCFLNKFFFTHLHNFW